MLTIPNYLVKIGTAIWLRAIIGLFFYLSVIFGRMFVSAGAHDHPYLTVVCGLFYEATCIIIFNLLYGRYSVGRDINTFNTFALFFALIYFFLSFANIDASTQLNFVAKGINGLIILRCVFPTERALFAQFSPIEITKKWILKRQWFVNAYINGLTVAIFVFCAIPLFTMMYLINTDEMRASGIAVVLFAFAVAFESAKRYATTAPSVAAPAEQDEQSIADEEHTMGIARAVYCMLVVIAASIFVSYTDLERRFFNVGYASGYSDAKSGAVPKKETDFQKSLWCNMVMVRGQSNPPGLSCDDGPK